MIVLHATGFIGDKPELQYVGTAASRKAKVEFDVVCSRRAQVEGQWTDVWERARFVAWDEEAIRIAEIFEKGSNVTCFGVQETSSWVPKGGTERVYRTKYRLTGWDFTGSRRSGPADRQAPTGSRERSAPQARSDRVPAGRPGESRNFGRDGGEQPPARPEGPRSTVGGYIEM